jgi:replicative DNA helicase
MTMPFSEECEKGLLCSVLLEPALIVRVTADLFYEQPFKDLFQFLFDNFANVDSLDYAMVLGRMPEPLLAAIGGKETLAALYAYCPSSCNWSHYSKILVDLRDKRDSITTATQIIELAQDKESTVADIESLAKKIRSKVPATDNHSTGIELARSLNLWMEQIQNGEVKADGITWGFQGLPTLVDRLRPGELCLIGGRPGSGKTSIANSVVSLSCIPQGKSSLVFSLEMTLREATMRLLSIIGRIPLQHLQDQSLMTERDFRHYSTALAAIASSRLAVVDEILTIHQMYDKVRQIKETVGLDLVVIDHVGLLRMNSTDSRKRYESLDEAGRICKYMAKDFHLSVMLLTQINREDSSPFECSNLEAHCDQYLLVPITASDVVTKEIRVRKNRNGPAGTVPCKWYPECASFY